MTDSMTVKQLRENLEKLEQLGLGNSEVWKTSPGGLMPIERVEICDDLYGNEKKHVELTADYE